MGKLFLAKAYNTKDEELYHRVEEGLDRGTEQPRYHGDHRRAGWFDVFPIAGMDINIVRIPKKDTLVAWHRHQRQTDLWFVPQGSLQAGLFNSDTKELRWEFLTPERGEVLWIPANIWHGYRTREDNTILIYMLTNKYDGTDEERMSTIDAYEKYKINPFWDLE